MAIGESFAELTNPTHKDYVKIKLKITKNKHYFDNLYQKIIIFK